MIVTTTTRAIRCAALAACALSIVTVATPSQAEPTEASGGSMYSGVASNPTKNDRSSRSRSHRASQTAFRDAQASAGAAAGASFALGSSDVVSEARRYLGTNPTGRSSLWCAAFMNMVLERAGHKASGSNMASSFASYGRRVSGPQVGAIAVMSRGRRGGHVGVVSGIDPNGNPIVISGNHGRRVAESTSSRGRIYAYVMPN
jgi:uncharacterized protein (TIGR02594 family)